MTDEMKTRFKDAPWITKEPVFTLVGGAGGISSWLALFLTRAGFEVTIYDHDTIEAVNLAGQFFSKDFIGSYKTSAIQALILKFSDARVHVQNKKYDESGMVTPYTFSGFDNMEARKIMFEKWYESFKDDANALYIDGRLAAEQMQIFCVKPHLADEYRKYLFHDDEVQDTVCSMKQTSHTASMIASYMTSFFTNHIANIELGSKDRTVPFSFELYTPICLHTINEKYGESDKTSAKPINLE